MQLHARPITAREAVGPVGGMHARDQRDGFYQMGLKFTDRTSLASDQARKVRCVGPVKATGGWVREANPHRKISKNSRRKARRYGR